MPRKRFTLLVLTLDLLAQISVGEVFIDQDQDDAMDTLTGKSLDLRIFGLGKHTCYG